MQKQIIKIGISFSIMALFVLQSFALQGEEAVEAVSQQAEGIPLGLLIVGLLTVFAVGGFFIAQERHENGK